MKIKEIREALKMNQTEFAKHLGVTRVTVWKWETGKSDPTNYLQREINKLEKKIAKGK